MKGVLLILMQRKQSFMSSILGFYGLSACILCPTPMVFMHDMQQSNESDAWSFPNHLSQCQVSWGSSVSKIGNDHSYVSLIRYNYWFPSAHSGSLFIQAFVRASGVGKNSFIHSFIHSKTHSFRHQLVQAVCSGTYSWFRQLIQAACLEFTSKQCCTFMQLINSGCSLIQAACSFR